MGHTVNAQKQGLRPDRGILQNEHSSQEVERGVSSAWWYDNGWCATQCVPRQPVPCMCVGPILFGDTKTRLGIQRLIESDRSRVRTPQFRQWRCHSVKETQMNFPQRTRPGPFARQPEVGQATCHKPGALLRQHYEKLRQKKGRGSWAGWLCCCLGPKKQLRHGCCLCPNNAAACVALFERI